MKKLTPPFAQQNQPSQDMVRAWLTQGELEGLDMLQGGVSIDPETGLREYSKLAPILEIPAVREVFIKLEQELTNQGRFSQDIESEYKAFKKHAPRYQETKAEKSVKDLGRGEDKHLVLLPKNVAEFFISLNPNNSLNPKTGYLEFGRSGAPSSRSERSHGFSNAGFGMGGGNGRGDRGSRDNDRGRSHAPVSRSERDHQFHDAGFGIGGGQDRGSYNGGFTLGGIHQPQPPVHLPNISIPNPMKSVLEHAGTILGGLFGGPVGSMVGAGLGKGLTGSTAAEATSSGLSALGPIGTFMAVSGLGLPFPLAAAVTYGLNKISGNLKMGPNKIGINEGKQGSYQGSERGNAPKAEPQSKWQYNYPQAYQTPDFRGQYIQGEQPQEQTYTQNVSPMERRQREERKKKTFEVPREYPTQKPQKSWSPEQARISYAQQPASMEPQAPPVNVMQSTAANPLLNESQQQEAIKDYASKKQYDPVNVFENPGFSLTQAEKLKAMEQYYKAHQRIGELPSFEMDRFARGGRVKKHAQRSKVGLEGFIGQQKRSFAKSIKDARVAS